MSQKKDLKYRLRHKLVVPTELLGQVKLTNSFAEEYTVQRHGADAENKSLAWAPREREREGEIERKKEKEMSADIN